MQSDVAAVDENTWGTQMKLDQFGLYVEWWPLEFKVLKDDTWI
jgi:hypothetical protein